MNSRGQFHGLEVMLIFLGWLFILASAWGHTAQITIQHENQFLQEKAFLRTQAQLQTFIEQHHLNPWNGCAFFDSAKKRTITHVIEQSCLQQLQSNSPTEGITEVYLRTSASKQTYFSLQSNAKHCVSMERLVRMHETNEIALLGVSSCAE